MAKHRTITVKIWTKIITAYTNLMYECCVYGSVPSLKINKYITKEIRKTIKSI